MENATKALLIAASILIVIVLIAVGVLLIKNVSGTSDDAQKVGNSISISTGHATSDALGSIKGTIISKKKFNSFVDDIVNGKYSTTQQIFDMIKNEQNVKLSNQIELIGYYCTAIGRTMNADVFNGTDSEVIGRTPDLLEDGRIGVVDDPASTSSVKNHLKQVYIDLKGADANLNLVKIAYRLYLGYDEWGYVNKAVYFGYLENK